MGRPARVTVAPKQSLGQNFLIDDNIAGNIVRDMHLSPEDIVIEIGPGQGALTKHLAGKVRHLIAVEIDDRVIHDLKVSLPSSSVDILHEDFLETPLSELYGRFQRRLRIVGNIPYHMTSAILFKVFEEHAVVQDLTMMVQREVAQRLVAVPSTKAYGILAVFARFYGTPKMLFPVSPNCFYPKPKVISSLLQIVLHAKLPYTVDTLLFGEIVRTTFGKRRKTLRNSLQYLGRDPTIVKEITGSGMPWLDRRPEQLHIEDFVEITNHVERIISCRKQ